MVINLINIIIGFIFPFEFQKLLNYQNYSVNQDFMKGKLFIPVLAYLAIKNDTVFKFLSSTN